MDSGLPVISSGPRVKGVAPVRTHYSAGFPASNLGLDGDICFIYGAGAAVLGTIVVKKIAGQWVRESDPSLEMAVANAKHFAGIVDRPNSAMAFNNSTRTFTITAKPSKTFGIQQGLSYTEFPAGEAQSAQIPASDAEGLWFFYFDETATLQAGQGVSVVFEYPNAYAAAIYFDETNDKAILFFEERHGPAMDQDTHRRLHFGGGAVWVSGGLGVVLNGATNAQLAANALDRHAASQIRFTASRFMDEDLFFSISHAEGAGLAYADDLALKQFLGFADVVQAVNGSQVTLAGSHSLITGQRVTFMQGSNATTTRLETTIAAGATGTTFTLTSATALQVGDIAIVGARIPLFERSGPGGNYRKIDATDVPLLNVGGILQYNSYSVGAWGRTGVTNGRYASVFLCLTGNKDEPVVGLLGQGQSATTALTDYLSSSAADFTSMELGNLPFTECVVRARITFEGNSSWLNGARIRDVTILKASVLQGVAGASALGALSHNDTINRDAANSHPSAAIAYAPVVGQGSLIETDVGSAIRRLDSAPGIPQWRTGFEYRKDNVVFYLGILWTCDIAHTSGATFEADSGKWKAATFGSRIVSQTQMTDFTAPFSEVPVTQFIFTEGTNLIVRVDGIRYYETEAWSRDVALQKITFSNAFAAGPEATTRVEVFTEGESKQIFTLDAPFTQVDVTAFSFDASADLIIEVDGVKVYEGAARDWTRDPVYNRIVFNSQIEASAAAPVVVFVSTPA